MGFERSFVFRELPASDYDVFATLVETLMKTYNINDQGVLAVPRAGG